MNTQRKFRHLSITKRIQIETLLKRKVPIKEIADFLGVHISTVYREIKRGLFDKKVAVKTVKSYYETEYEYVKTYSPDISESKYRLNLQDKGVPLKIGNDLEFANYIEDRIIRGKLTPFSVLGEIKQKKLHFNTSISINTLYSYIYKGVFLNLSMEHLELKGRRKRKNSIKVSRPPKGTSIEQRPQEVSDRSTFGHWEMDCVCGPRTSSCSLLVLTERVARKEIIFKIENKTADNVVRCLNSLERKFGKTFSKVFKTITVDNGSEFASFNELQKSVFGKKKRTAVYYCHPYCSSERGSNERMNREIRRIFPKGTNFSKITKKDVRHLEEWLNDYPRGVLGFKTPNQVFNEYISALN